MLLGGHTNSMQRVAGAYQIIYGMHIMQGQAYTPVPTCTPSPLLRCTCARLSLAADALWLGDVSGLLCLSPM